MMTDDQKAQYKARLEKLAAENNFAEFEKVKNEYIQARDAKPVNYQFSESARNFLPSLGQAFADIGNVIMRPDIAATNVAKLAQSGVANLGQAVEDALPENVLSNINRFTNTLGLPERATSNVRADRVPNQEMGEAFAGMLDDRYGSMDALKTTAMQDPAGLLLDLSSVLTGGGAAVAKTGGKVGAVGEKIEKVGRAIDPLTTSLKTPGALFEKLAGQTASKKLYQSAMKPPSKNLQVSPGLLDEGLALGATPSRRSIEKIAQARREIGEEVKGMEQTASAIPAIPSKDLFSEIPDLRDRFAPPRMNAMQDAKLIDEIVKRQSDSLEAFGRRKLTVAEVALIKRDIYKNVDFDIVNKPNSRKLASEETQKAIAKAARKAIEKVVPEVKELNKVYGRLTDVQEKLQVPANRRLGNRDLIGIGAPLRAIAGEAVGGALGTTLAASGVLDMFPTLKANAAVQMSRLGDVVQNRYTQPILQGISMGGRLEEVALQALDEQTEKEMEGN